MSVSDAAAALRKSPQGRIVALRFGYPAVGELADWLEAHADEALAQRLAPVVMRDIARYGANAIPSAQAVRMGRGIVAAIRRYASPGGCS